MTVLMTTMPGRMQIVEPENMPTRLLSVIASWDDEDPMAVTFTFIPEDDADAEKQVWRFGRDLAQIGLGAMMWVGKGQVQVGSRGADWYCIRLRPHDGQPVAQIIVPRSQVAWLLAQSQELIGTATSEELTAVEREIDRDLAGLFGEDAA